MNNGQYLGIDIGGTFIKLGVVTDQGEVLQRHKVSVDRSEAEHIMATLINAIKEFCFSMGTGAESFAGIGISAPGSIDSINGRVALNGGNVPNWSGTEVFAALKEEFGLPVAIANDGNCAALGEAWTGAAKGCSEVVCITLGTGVGGGIISGGKLVEGRTGFAGEIGHFPTHAGDGALCVCGRRGCYERYASTSALVRKASAVNPDWDSGYNIFKSLDEGDADAATIVDGWLDEIAYGIAGLVHIFNPEVVLIGGGVSAQEKFVITPVKERVLSLVMPDFAESLEVKSAELGNDAGMVGAVKHLLDSKGE